MEIFNVIKKRRSVRSFLDKPVSDEDAMKILDAARLAPSGANKQRWKFIYVNDKNVLRMIKNCSPGFYGDATAAIIMGTDTSMASQSWLELQQETSGRSSFGNIIAILDIGFAAENMSLAAEALGLGSCAIASFNVGCISKVINAPENFLPILVFSLGHPDKIPPMPTKKSLSEIVFLNEYGKNWDKMGESK